MRILASTGPLFARPLDWAFAAVKEAGYDGVELMVTRDPDTQEAERILALAAAEGVEVPVIHGPFLLLTRRVYGTDLVQKAHRSLELAREVGADLMIVHPPMRWQRTFHRWLVDSSGADAAGASTRVGVENLYPVGVGGRSVRFHRYTRPEHLLPFPHVVLDTSHLGIAGVDPTEAYLRLGERIVHLHVSDNRGGGRDSHAPLGHGILPLARFLHTVADDTRLEQRLAATGGTSITLELDCRRYLDDRAALVGYLRQELQKCRALLDGASAEDVLGRPDVVPAPRLLAEDDGDQPTAPPVTDGGPATPVHPTRAPASTRPTDP